MELQTLPSEAPKCFEPDLLRSACSDRGSRVTALSRGPAQAAKPRDGDGGRALQVAEGGGRSGDRALEPARAPRGRPAWYFPTRVPTPEHRDHQVYSVRKIVCRARRVSEHCGDLASSVRVTVTGDRAGRELPWRALRPIGLRRRAPGPRFPKRPFKRRASAPAVGKDCPGGVRTGPSSAGPERVPAPLRCTPENQADAPPARPGRGSAGGARASAHPAPLEPAGRPPAHPKRPGRGGGG
jgi:hypothetical protein